MDSTIYKYTLNRPFTKKEKENFIKYIKNIDEIIDNIGNARTKNMFILEDEALYDLKCFCLNSLKKVTKEKITKSRKGYKFFLTDLI